MTIAPFFWTVLALAALVVAPAVHAQRVIYVDTDAAGANDGSSWANAFVFLQDALEVVRDGDEVWVAEGVYRPDQGAGILPGDREATFRIRAGIPVYGGFGGNETDRSKANWRVHQTVLSGDLLRNDDERVGEAVPTRQDNSCHLIRASAPVGMIRLDGVVMEGGNANETCAAPRGGGAIYIEIGPLSTAHLSGLRVTRNSSYGGGGGILVGGATTFLPSGVLIEDAEFEENVASRGGGLLVDGASLTVRNATFRRNMVSSGSGGALFTWANQVRLREVFFIENQGYGMVSEHSDLLVVGGHFFGNTGIWGSALSVSGVQPTLVANSVFSGNSASFGSTIFVGEETRLELVNSTLSNNRATSELASVYCWPGCSLRIENSVLWDPNRDIPQVFGRWNSLEIGHSILSAGVPEGAIDLGNNLASDPQFVDPEGHDGLIGTPDDNLSLRVGSPGVDRGTNAALPPDSMDLDGDGDTAEPLPIDIRGFDRRAGDSVDVGAYELIQSAGVFKPAIPREAWTLVASPFPNPFAMTFTLTFDAIQFTDLSIRVFDLLGRLMAGPHRVHLIPGSEASISLGHESWPVGAYLVVLDSANAHMMRTVFHTQ